MTVELDKAIRLRNYAEELRLIAAENRPHNRRVLLEVAADYDRMAIALEAVAESKRAVSDEL